MPGPAAVTLASSPVAYEILYDEPATITGGNDQPFHAEMSFLLAQNDVGSFVSWALGSEVTITLTGGTVVTRIIPLQHPVYTALLCDSVDGRATGTWASANPTAFRAWDKAKVRLGFSTVPFAVDGSAPMSVTRRMGGSEQHTQAGSRLQFVDLTPCQADASETVPVATYETTVFNCVGLGDTVAMPLEGKVNSTTFLGIAAGLVYFDHMSGDQVKSVGNYSTYTRSYMFKYRPIDWNKFKKPDGSWDYLYKPGGFTSAYYVYGLADLNALLV